nr:MAG TPA: hypothetical protein [Caudoviricetes sp.]
MNLLRSVTIYFSSLDHVKLQSEMVAAFYL